MRQSFLLLIAIGCFISAFAQPSQADVEKYHIRKVIIKKTIDGTVYTDTYWYDGEGNDSAMLVNNKTSIIKSSFKGGKLIGKSLTTDGKQGDIFVYEYAADGSYKEMHTDGEFGMTSYKWFDAKKRLQKTQSPDGNTITNNYDAKGNLISAVSDGSNGGMKIKRTYFYNAKNSLTKTEQEMDGMKSTSSYSYNTKNQLAKRSDDDGYTKSTTTYEYNDKGLLLKTIRQAKMQNEVLPTETTVYEYYY